MSAATSSVSPGDPRAAWLLRVLGFMLPAAPGSDAPGPQSSGADLAAEFLAANAAWQKAVAAVGRQMSGLKKALLASGDVEYEEIAEHGLDDVLGDRPQTLTALLDQAGGGAAQLQAGAARALPALAALRDDLGSEAVAVCEANPVGAAVAIRATLGPIITRLQDVLGRASSG